MYMPTPQTAQTEPAILKLLPFSFLFCLKYIFSNSFLLDFLIQLTQLDNPAFSFLTSVNSLFSFPIFVLRFCCSFLTPRRSIRLPTCLQERLVPLLHLVFPALLLPPTSPSFSHLIFCSTALLSLSLPPFIFDQKPSGGSFSTF